MYNKLVNRINAKLSLKIFFMTSAIAFISLHFSYIIDIVTQQVLQYRSIVVLLRKWFFAKSLYHL